MHFNLKTLLLFLTLSAILFYVKIYSHFLMLICVLNTLLIPIFYLVNISIIVHFVYCSNIVETLLLNTICWHNICKRVGYIILLNYTSTLHLYIFILKNFKHLILFMFFPFSKFIPDTDHLPTHPTSWSFSLSPLFLLAKQKQNKKWVLK